MADPARSTRGAWSFRDPAGYLLKVEERLLRVVSAPAWPDLLAVLDSRTGGELMGAGRLVGTRPLPPDEARALLGAAAGPPEAEAIADGIGGVVEHERVPFPSFPYEWPPEMLHAAGRLTLDLAESLLPDDYGLKDATPYNVLFRGPQPVFVDVLSLERRDPGSPTWLPYAQFARTFLLPLLAHRVLALPLGPLLAARRDGLEPPAVYAMCSVLQRLRPPVLGLVTLPAWLGRRREAARAALYAPRAWTDPERARFVLRHLFRRLRRQLDRVAPPARASTWTGYMEGHSYVPAAMEAKEAFVREALDVVRPRRVLDVGCNTGHFSALAAGRGAAVVAIDSDPAVVGAVWRRAGRERLDVLPLVVDLARPTPAVGWRNEECASFLDRARGHFDAVLMLAVVHHLLVTERVPLPEILTLLAELTRDAAVVEFVPPDDPMFRILTRGRDHLFTGLTRAAFERACAPRFHVARAERLHDSGRWMYLLRRRAAPA